MNKRTEAIVLSNTPLNEADLIVTYLTLDFGLLEVFAKSPRKVGSRFGSSLEPLTYSKIAFIGKEQASLPRLIQADIIRPFHRLREYYKLFVVISEALELTKRILPKHLPQRGPFQLLLNLLMSLESGKDERKQLLYYKLKLLKISGFAPALQHCVRCEKETSRFSLNEGALVCSRCSDNDNDCIEIGNRIKGLYNYLLKIRPAILDRIKIEDESLSGLERVINSHINYNIIDKKLNTHEFLVSMKRG